MPKPKVFISATTSDLGTIRERVKQALLTLECVPDEQTNFPPDYRSIEEMLRAKIKKCHVVIHIAGLRYGAEPQQRSAGQERRSYTQMEYDIARKLKKPVYTFVCGKDFPYDACDQEDDEKRRLQELHRKRLLGGTMHFEEVRQKEELDRKVREIRYDKHLLWTTRTLVALSVIILVVSIAFGYALLSHVRQLVPTESADRLFDAKDYAGAYHVYAGLSDREPANVQLHRRIEECARKGKLEKAFLDRYLALVQQEPANAIFHNYLGNAYLMLDPLDKDGKAREQYETALRLDSKTSLPLANLGILTYRAGKTNEAESFFKRYLAVETGDAQGWVNLGLLYIAKVQTATNNTQATTDGLNALHHAIRLNPSSAPAYKALGRLHAATGHKADALNAFQRSLSLNYEQPDVRQQVELLAWESGGARFPGIDKDDFKTRGRVGTDSTVPAAVAVLQLLDKSQFQQAETTCREWLKSEPDNPFAYHLLARALAAMGQAQQSSAASEQATRLWSRSTP